MPGRDQVIAWAQLSQQSLLRDALQSSSLQLAAIGSDDLGEATELSEAFGVERATDLRHTSHRPGVRMAWFLLPRSLSEDECRVLRERPMKVMCMYPPTISLSDAAGDTSSQPDARFGPLLQVSSACRAASDVLEPFGERRCLQIFMGCRAPEGSTVARLFDAMAMVHRLLGDAEAVTASMASPLAGALDTLDQFTGPVNAHVRCAGDSSASITTTNQVGRWQRALTLIGDGGMLSLDDCGFTWTDRDGDTIAEHRVPPPHSPGALLGEQARRWLDQMDAADVPPDVPAVLSMCEAARLSCLTGQPEQPHCVMKMLRNP